MRFAFTVLLFLGWGVLFSFGQDGKTPDAQNQTESSQTGYVPVRTFDPARDAAADIDAAIVRARSTGKRILLDVGGDWCPWCHALDQFFQEHPDVRRLRDANFVVVNVYCGTDNKNEKTLSHYSKVLGIPHFFVLEKDGTLLYSQHVIDLTTNGDYSPDKMKEFLSKWSAPPKKAETSNLH